MSNHSDSRLKDIFLPPTEENIALAKVIIIGVPTDEGIRRNGGRVGAAQAPDAIRKQLDKLTPMATHGSIADLKVVDFGNVRGSTLEEMHNVARNAVSSFIESGKIIIALGGGHDITYPLVKGFVQGLGGTAISLLNIDAHLDVREKKNGLHHSGSSFRLLIKEGIVQGKNFAEFGIQSFCYSSNDLSWLKSQGSSVYDFDDLSGVDPSSEVEKLLSSQLPQYVSFDIDSIRSSDAPGSSAPSPIGLTSEDAVNIFYDAGLHRGTQMVDIVEVNPLFDIDNRTAKLAARMIAMFLLGVSRRAH
ncbi:MAG: formimidoylglutamase [bacterium]